MRFKIGDKVRLTANHPDSDDFGLAGWVGVVVDTAPDRDYPNEDIEVDFGKDEVWWQPENILVLVDSDIHTPADLAMALELADLVDAEGRSGELDATFNPIMNTCGPRCLVCTAEWLRGEVIAALYEGAH